MSKFGWNYPPGAANDPSAPYNQSQPPECDECGGVFAEDGHEGVVVVVDGEERTEPCPNEGMNAQDYTDAKESQHAEQRMDQRRLEDAME